MMSTRTIVGMNSMYEKKERTEKGGRVYKTKNAVDKVKSMHSFATRYSGGQMYKWVWNRIRSSKVNLPHFSY